MPRETFRLMRRPNGQFDLVPINEVASWELAHRPKPKPLQAGWTPRRVERGSWVFRNGRVVPKYAGEKRTRGGGLQVIPDIEPFQNIAIDNAVIGGRRQRRDMMRAHGLIDVGTEARAELPKPPKQAVNMEVVSAIKRAMGKL
jgi:hypothetical protein